MHLLDGETKIEVPHLECVEKKEVLIRRIF